MGKVFEDSSNSQLLSTTDRYLQSVFKVLFEMEPECRRNLGISPEELGGITAKQAFMDADTDSDGQLSYDEFKLWYVNAGKHSVKVRLSLSLYVSLGAHVN